MASVPKFKNLLKRDSGTSLESKGFAKPQGLDAEQGSARPVIPRERVPELSSRQQAVTAFTRMMREDAAVSVSVKAWKTPILGAEYFIEPSSANQDDLDIAEFVDFNVFHNINSPWIKSLQHILSLAEYGFSVLELVMTTGEWAPARSGANRKTYTLLKKLAPRPATTITTFHYDDNGGPESLDQNAIDGEGKVKEVNLPIDKLIVFSLDPEAGDLEGKSILRTAYPHWYYKDHLYKIDAIQKERHGIGVPRLKLPANASTKDRQLAWELVRNLRTNENSGIVEPFGFEITFAELSGNLVDALKSADHHNSMIMLNVMAQFLIMGMTEGGGRATAASQLDVYMKSLRAYAGLICDFFNLYLIPKLVAFNFPTDRYPQMKVRNIGETRDLQQLGAAVANLLSQQGLTATPDLENWLRDAFGAPRMAIGQGTVDTTSGDGQSSTNGKPTTDKGGVLGDRQGNMNAGKDVTG